jgi:hypothetical protein
VENLRVWYLSKLLFPAGGLAHVCAVNAFAQLPELISLLKSDSTWFGAGGSFFGNAKGSLADGLPQI